VDLDAKASLAFDSLVLLVARGIWLYMNNVIFSRATLSHVGLAHELGQLLDDWCRAGSVARSWLQGE
jgi:hypothetical protein